MDISRRNFLLTSGFALTLPALAAAEPKAPLAGGVGSLLDGTGLVRIPAGSFSMGSLKGNPDEGPVRRVRISRPFEIGKYEVTQAQWEGVIRDAHMSPDEKTNPSNFAGMDLPVESVTWDDTRTFLKRLSARSETHRFRLPTEAEWEYAASLNTLAGAPADYAWFEATSQKQTHPAGLKRPGKLGLCDMFGNVSEWVEDWYAREYLPEPADPQGPATGSYKVYRGGCWFDPVKNLRASYRGFDLPANKTYNVGFRVVRVPKG